MTFKIAKVESLSRTELYSDLGSQLSALFEGEHDFTHELEDALQVIGRGCSPKGRNRVVDTRLLQANDVDELDRAGAARQTCVGDLVRIEDERRSLCRMLNIPADASGIDRMLTWCDPSHTLKRRWAACAEQALRCRERNDRNGALVAARLKKVEGMLDVLTGRSNQPKVYGRQGSFDTAPRAPRVLATV